MKTVDKVKEDLIDIRYYYVNKMDFDIGQRLIGGSPASELVEQYNRHIRNAPVKLFGLYVCLYLENNMQIEVASKWKCSVGHIKVLNKKLYEFFVEEINKEER